MTRTDIIPEASFNETLPRMKLQPLILINAVGLTRRLLAFAPRLKRLAEVGWIRSLEEVMPAVTCSAQASMLPASFRRSTASSATAGCFETQARSDSGSSRAL